MNLTSPSKDKFQNENNNTDDKQPEQEEASIKIVKTPKRSKLPAEFYDLEVEIHGITYQMHRYKCSDL